MTDSSRRERSVAIFWDYENVPLPSHVSPADAGRAIQTAVSKYGGRTEMRRVYYDPEKNRGNKPRNPSAFDTAGFDLVQTPSRNTKETLDKKLIVDVLTFAWDYSAHGREKPCVVLITSDGDYANMLTKLRDRGVVNVVMYGKDASTASILVDNAEVALSFEREVLSSVSGSPAKSAGASENNKPASGMNAASSNDRALKRQDSSRSDSSNSPRQKKREVPQGDGKGSFLFIRQLPKSTQPKEVADFIEGTYSIPIRWVIMECFRKDRRIHFAHVALANESDGDFLVALAEAKKLIYKGSNLEIKIDSTPPSMNDIPRNMIYKKGETTSPQNDAMWGGFDAGRNDDSQDVAAYCVCLSIKQKSWSLNRKVPEENCWVPNNILRSSYQPPSLSSDQASFDEVCEEAQDNAINEGYVETARYKLRDKNSYVTICLDEPTSNLSAEFFLRLTESGRELAGTLEADEVKSYCSTLFNKQRLWERGTRVKLEACWIPFNVMEEAYRPSYPLANDGGFAMQCRDTRDLSISENLVEVARKDENSDTYVSVDSAKQSSDHGRLSKEFFLRLTASGRDFAKGSADTSSGRRRPRGKSEITLERPTRKAKLASALSSGR